MTSVKGTARHMTDETRQMVKEHPLSLSAMAFGAGVGIGLLTALLVSEPPRSRRDALAEHIVENLSRLVPDSVSRRVS